MTVRRRWLLVLSFVAVLSVLINAIVLSALTGRYFDSYLKRSYENNLEELQNHLTEQMESEEFQLLEADLEPYLVDPIIAIKVYDAQGTLIVSVQTDVASHVTPNGNTPGRRYSRTQEETDAFDLTDDGIVVGQMNITRYGALNESFVSLDFRRVLIRNSLISVLLVVLLSVVVSRIVSKKMSKDLIATAELAQNLEMGNDTAVQYSGLKEVGIIQQSLVSLRSRLKLKQKSRKALIDELVHQTRTPLTILQTHLEGFEDGLVEMNREELAVCRTQVETVTSIIENMSDLIDAGQKGTDITVETFDVGTSVKKIVAGLNLQFKKKGVALRIDSHEKLSIRTDRYRFSQSLYNLLTNAYKYTPEGGSVTISYKTSDEFLLLTVRDTGIGIAATEQAKIFDAYYRAADAVRIPGEGLGLYVVKENIEQIGGTVAVTSEQGKGSTFVVRIPLDSE